MRFSCDPPSSRRPPWLSGQIVRFPEAAMQNTERGPRPSRLGNHLPDFYRAAATEDRRCTSGPPASSRQRRVPATVTTVTTSAGTDLRRGITHCPCCLARTIAGNQHVPTHRPLIRLEKFGAGEGIRTLDPNLGKVAEIAFRSID